MCEKAGINIPRTLGLWQVNSADPDTTAPAVCCTGRVFRPKFALEDAILVPRLLV
jgi:hypothetical protein